jgi:DNA-binding transcriptional LysR family regulator
MGAAVRRVVVWVPTFAEAGCLVANSELVTSVPRSIAMHLASTHALRVLPLPVPLPPGHISLAWHERFDRDPASSWLRGLLLDVLPRPWRPEQMPSVAAPLASPPAQG